MIPFRLRSRPTPPRVAALASIDAPALARIHAEAFARPWEAHDIERMLADPAFIGDGVFTGSNNSLEGFALSRQVLDEAEILTLAMTRGRRGRGYGRALLGAHLGRLAARGVTSLFLEVEEANHPAIGLYRTFGFDEIGRRDGYYAKPEGRAGALVLGRSLA